MSLNRQRNIFTLGSQKNLKRHPPTDPFERDPFKIHSYNFRYADRPSFQMPVMQQRTNNNDHSSECQTYFYNCNFPNSSTTRNVAERKPNVTQFQENRRKTFLNDARGLNGKNSHVAQTTGKYFSTLLNTPYGMANINHNSKANNSLTNNHSPAAVNNFTKPDLVKRIVIPLITANTSTDRIHGMGSGCEISIDIKSLNNKSQHENINIKIETDNVCRNSSTSLTKTSNKLSNQTKLAADHLLNTSNSFVIKKGLSKFLLHQNEQKNFKLPEKNYAKELNCLYSSAQKLNKQSKHERLPTLIPLTASGCCTQRFGKNNSSFANINFPNKKSMIQKVKENLSVYNSTTTSKSISRNNLYRQPYNKGSGASKISNSTSLTAKQSYGKKPASKHSLQTLSQNIEVKRMQSSAKSPLNVTINVIADKLKLLRV